MEVRGTHRILHGDKKIRYGWTLPFFPCLFFSFGSSPIFFFLDLLMALMFLLALLLFQLLNAWCGWCRAKPRVMMMQSGQIYAESSFMQDEESSCRMKGFLQNKENGWCRMEWLRAESRNFKMKKLQKMWRLQVEEEMSAERRRNEDLRLKNGKVSIYRVWMLTLLVSVRFIKCKLVKCYHIVIFRLVS